MNKYYFIGTLISILFFIIFTIYFTHYQNKIIGYQIIYKSKDIDYDLNSLEKDLKRKNCNDYCDKSLCDQYNNKLEVYKKCIQCTRQFKCYNSINNRCKTCFSMGINQCHLPIDPKNNFCRS